MQILAIDPGTEKSGWVLYEPGQMKIRDCGISPNLNLLSDWSGAHDDDQYLVIERIVGSFVPKNRPGQFIGKEVFQTCEFIGALFMAYYNLPDWEQRDKYLISRQTVRAHITGSAKAGDSDVRQAIIDRFPPTGGGKCRQIGTKKQPGPLYGVKSHCWSALAVAICWYETTLFKTERKSE